jgi:hypothetical protein
MRVIRSREWRIYLPPNNSVKQLKLEAYELRSCVFINDKNGGWIVKPLPVEAQLSCIYGIAMDDYDGDGKMDLLTGGNFYQSKPEVGIYDASYGLLLKGDGNGDFGAMKSDRSGFFFKRSNQKYHYNKCR